MKVQVERPGTPEDAKETLGPRLPLADGATAPASSPGPIDVDTTPTSEIFNSRSPNEFLSDFMMEELFRQVFGESKDSSQ